MSTVARGEFWGLVKYQKNVLHLQSWAINTYQGAHK